MHSPADSPAERSSTPAKRQARPGWFRRVLGDVLFVTKRDRKWWVLPLILLLLILGALLAFAAVLGPLAPFVYPLL